MILTDPAIISIDGYHMLTKEYREALKALKDQAECIHRAIRNGTSALAEGVADAQRRMKLYRDEVKVITTLLWDLNSNRPANAVTSIAELSEELLEHLLLQADRER